MAKELYRNEELREEYRGHFGNRCEVWEHLPDDAKEKCERLNLNKGKIDVHHIFHNIAPIDEWSNIIAVRHKIHLGWGHAYNLKEFTIVCVYAKWWKSKQETNRLNPYPSDEFNLEEMRYCLGRCVKSWLEWQVLYETRLDDEYKAMCQEILESF